jgi:hypothetical protein
MKAIEAIIKENDGPNTKHKTNSEANCYLTDENKTMWGSSNRIINHF